jgi:hypothetical protein
MTFAAWIKIAMQRHSFSARANQRTGQSLFNSLYEFRPDLADAIRNSHIDPFYKDENLNNFFRWIVEHWEQ